MIDTPFASLTELADGLQRGLYSAHELAVFYLNRIDRANGMLNAYCHVDHEGALRLAAAADERRAAGYTLGPLDGLPIAFKDLCDIEGCIGTAGSPAWRERRGTVTATVVRRLLAAGMVPLGKTHMVEFAFGGWGTNAGMGTPRNPWDLQRARIPGGSSSGSGVAVAAGLAPAALGSDTGGSVRIPAVLNGITGLKTSRGLLSLFGVIPLSSTLDTIGPMTHTAADALLLTKAMAGPDPLDPVTWHGPICRWPAPQDTRAGQPLDGMRIALMPPERYPVAVHPDALAALDDARRVLESLGAHIVPRGFPFDFDDILRRNGAIMAAEAYALHCAYIDDESLPIGAVARRKIRDGKAISAADYIGALQHHATMRAAWLAWMEDLDALLTPCLPGPACVLEDVDELNSPLSAFTRAGNYLDACALALPAGFSAAGLPVGVQLMGKPGAEDVLTRIGMAFQHATDWHRRHPDLQRAGL
jgi:aspartyl-tRNA(Asn)/glutamyl-tRNA(Gln) amidotransferase subunit A